MRISKKDLGWFCAIVLVALLGNWKEAKSGAKNPAACKTPETFKADANGDGKLDITDPLQVLRYLFQGGEAPVCFAQEEDPGVAASLAALQADVETIRTELAGVQGSLPTVEDVATELITNHLDSLPQAPAGNNGTQPFTGPVRFKTNRFNKWLTLESPAASRWNFDYLTDPDIGRDVLRVGPPGSPLQLYLPNEDGGMRMYLWTPGREVPDLPHTKVKPTFALWGDMLVGDIVCIERNPMSMFFRQEKNLSASAPTIFFCANKGINTDTDGGAGILLHPDHHRDLARYPNDPVNHPSSGSLHLIAYGRGTGPYANKIRMSTRVGSGQIVDRMIVGDGHVQINGTLRATGGVLSSREEKKDISKLSLPQAQKLVEELDTVTFINKSGSDQTRRVGFIAEEVPDAFAGEGRRGVDYMGVAALLTKVVQQQQRQIADLSARLTALEASKVGK